MITVLKHAFKAFVMLACLSAGVMAQERRGNINGVIRDKDGVIPGAVVRITIPVQVNASARVRLVRGANHLRDNERLKLERHSNPESKVLLVVFAARICGESNLSEIEGVDVRARIGPMRRIRHIESFEAHLDRDGL